MSKEKMVIQSYDSIFLNSKVLFVEYIDIIKSPYFILLTVLSEKEDSGILDPFDISEIKGLPEEKLAEWYYLRKNQNFLLDLISEEKRGDVKTKDVDHFLDKQLRSSYELIKYARPLNFSDVISKVYRNDDLLVKKAIIYYPYDNPNVRRDVEESFPDSPVEFAYGNILDVLKEIPTDSTYVFSDISKVIALEEADKLDYSSLIIPEDYNYNRDEEGNFIIDFDAYRKGHIYKLNRFYATIED